MYPELETKDLLETPELEVDGDTHQSLETTAKWTRFISLTVFICSGVGGLILLIGGLTAIQNLGRYSRFGGLLNNDTAYGVGMVFVVILVIALVIIWYNYLYKFSLRLKEALYTQDAYMLTAAFKALKTHLIFSIVLSALGILFSLSTTIITLIGLSRF